MGKLVCCARFWAWVHGSAAEEKHGSMGAREHGRCDRAMFQPECQGAEILHCVQNDSVGGPWILSF